MKLESIRWKNFKSYGNGWTELNFKPEGGELILITGTNGAGKSSIRDVIDFNWFGKVLGKNNVAKLSSLPNRINGDLKTESIFRLNSNEKIKVERGLLPSVFEIEEGDEVHDKAGKKFRQQYLEDKLGFNFKTYKSFISVSIDDFKNFLSLSPSEKRELIDKLFSLEILNELHGILKDLKKVNYNEVKVFEKEVQELDFTINQIQESIKNFNLRNTETDQREFDSLKIQMNSLKPSWQKWKDVLEKGKDIFKEISSSVEENKETLRGIFNQKNEIENRISLIESGKCPRCETSLHSQDFLEELEELKASNEKFSISKDKIEKDLSKSEKKLSQVSLKLEKAEEEFSEITQQLREYKGKYDVLKEKLDISNDLGLEEFQKSVEVFVEKRREGNKELENSYQEMRVYEAVEEIFKEDGIKTKIITSILPPLNKWFDYFLRAFNLPFKIELTDYFDTIITQLGGEVDLETLSSGETKKANIALLLSYLQIQQMKKPVNILFLDEIFASISVDGINEILPIIKNFAVENKMNIFLVHHAYIESKNFDKILYIEKGIFSELKVLEGEDSLIQIKNDY